MRKGKRHVVNVESTATAVAVLVAAVVPELVEAVEPDVLASLKYFLVSVVGGEKMVAAIGSAMTAISIVNPVQRN